MRSIVALCLMATAVMAMPESPAKGFRLIQTDEAEPPFWVSPKVAHLMTESHVQYFDLTENFEVIKPEVASRYPVPDAPSHQAEVNAMIARINMAGFQTFLTSLSNFQNRYYNNSPYGVQSAEWIFSQIESLINSSNRTDITVEYFEHSFDQPSIIVHVAGSVGGEVVVIGGHQDSTSSGMPTGRAPGADDDGSGSTTVYEALRILIAANFKPELDIEFMFYAGEEAGLLGSNAIANAYGKSGAAVRGACQFDMVGYNRATPRHVAIITDFTDADLNEFTRQLVDEYLAIGWTNSRCGYACSDHASWYRAGYRASFPFEAVNSSPYIHTSSDTIANVNFDHCHEFVKLALGFMVEMSYI